MTEFNGLKIPTLKIYAEALLSVVHAIYKERIYTLNDYVTVKRWLDKRTLRLAEELNCTEAVEIAKQVNDTVEENKDPLPYKMPMWLWIKILSSKVLHDSTTKATMLNVM